MIAKIGRYICVPMMMVVLWVAVLVVSSATAEAQAPAKDTRGAEYVTVAPGDSLWSISAERLGTKATPQRVARGAERIYAFNRVQIGGDPNVIQPGQELLLPPVGGRLAVEPSSGQEAAEPAPVRPASRAEESGTETSTRPTKSPPEPRPERGAVEEAPGSATERIVLPAAPAADPAPRIWSPSPNAFSSPVAVLAGSVRSTVPSVVDGLFASGRQALGLTIVLLTWLVGCLMAWKLPMRRDLADAERRRMIMEYTALAENYANHIPSPDSPDRAGTRARPPAPSARERGSGAHGRAASPARNGLYPIGLASVARGKRKSRGKQAVRARASRTRRLPRRGSAVGVHNPEIRRHPRRVPRTGRRRAVGGGKRGRR